MPPTQALVPVFRKGILMTGLARAALLAAAVHFWGGVAAATEEDFAFVDHMPHPDGAKISTVTREEPEAGLVISQTIFRQDLRDLVIDTYVVAARCEARGNAPTGDTPYIVAVKYKPRDPKTFAVATLHDIYKQVFVRDRENRIRAYDDLNGREMIDLTETFKPDCPRV